MPNPFTSVTIVGPGRLGTALARALRDAGVEIAGPLGRGATVQDADVVLLCVPDGQIATAAATIPAGPIIGHCSGALTLAVLGDRDSFSLHPLLSVTKETATFAGAGCAIASSGPRARRVCLELARGLEMRPFEVDDSLRPLYHAAAAVAAGNVVAVAMLAERLMSLAGVERDYLIPLVRSAVDNWARLGPSALTGPIARGDDAVVRQHRAAIAAQAPDALALWDALADATRALAKRTHDRT